MLVKAANEEKGPRGAADGGTREQILTVASNLFAVHGYYGTTTREIALAVGIRQPSLFHHFDSKAAIMEALLEHDLARSVPARERIARADQPAAVRLYRYVFEEVTHIAGSRYNLAGVYTDEVRASPEFEPWHRRRRRLHRAIERIIRDGQSTNEFVAFEPLLVREAILGILGRTLTRYSGGQAEFGPALPHQIASLVLRAILEDARRIEAVVTAAGAGDPRIDTAAHTAEQPGV
jgi:AcrR family transcriptional regulator